MDKRFRICGRLVIKLFCKKVERIDRRSILYSTEIVTTKKMGKLNLSTDTSNQSTVLLRAKLV